jgi:hypothetical protein
VRNQTGKTNGRLIAPNTINPIAENSQIIHVLNVIHITPKKMNSIPSANNAQTISASPVVGLVTYQTGMLNAQPVMGQGE